LLPSVIDISLQIFVKLIASFKDHLKAEIEVFIDKVFLPILDSENSSGEHKALVLEVFHTICQDPQALVEIFLNYDCNFENKDLFRRIIITLSKVAKGGKAGLANPQANDGHSNKKGEDIRATLQLKGLQALVSTTHSLTKSSINDPLSSDPLRPMLARRNTITSNSKLASSSSLAAPNDEHDDDNDGGGGGGRRSSGDLSGHEEQLKNISEKNMGVSSTSSTSSTSSSLEVSKNSRTRSNSASQDQQGLGDVGNAAVESFEVKKKQQEELDDGVLKFNLNPKKGLQYLADTGHLTKPLDPKNIAHFLHVQQDKLDKTAIGELLGKEKDYMDGLCIKILHEYIDSMDFTNKPLDEAIRHFLSGFRLPGEAQKIDRMMEKFSERFCVQNSNVFLSPDTAFVLSFSIIMLNTDLHNPAIQDDRRMTKAGFRRQAEGIANGQNLEDSYLDAIFDRIKQNPISLKEDDQLRASTVPVGGGLSDLFSSAATVAWRRKQEAYTKEREDIVRESQLMFNQVGKRRQRLDYISLAEMTDEHVRPMFEVAWGPILGVYVHVLDQLDDPSIVTLCLEGLKD
jgi:brefeldin A-inhibited guanine nucleotide-exchange protein